MQEIKMIITCPNCDTVFKVPDGAIDAEGRFVRCSHCSHEWLVQMGASEISREEIGTSPEIAQIALPARNEPEPKAGHIHNSKFVKILMPVAAALSVLAFLVLMAIYKHEKVMDKFPKSKSIYTMLGVLDGRAFVLERVNCTTKPNGLANSGDGVELLIEAIVRNKGNTHHKLGQVKFAVYDSNKNFLVSHILNYNEVVGADKIARVEGRLSGIPQEAMFIALDFGNGTDVALNNLNTITRM